MENDGDAGKAGARVVFVENVGAPEFFCAESIGFLFNQENVHITFASPRSSYDPANPAIARVVNLRVVMPIAAAEALANGLQDFISDQLTRRPPPVLPPPSVKKGK